MFFLERAFFGISRRRPNEFTMRISYCCLPDIRVAAVMVGSRKTKSIAHLCPVLPTHQYSNKELARRSLTGKRNNNHPVLIFIASGAPAWDKECFMSRRFRYIHRAGKRPGIIP